MRMLEGEGFAYQHYIDIFDGGPTMTAQTDAVRSIREAQGAAVTGTDAEDGAEALIATGRLANFRCGFGRVRGEASGVALSADVAALLGVEVGDQVLHVAR